MAVPPRDAVVTSAVDEVDVPTYGEVDEAEEATVLSVQRTIVRKEAVRDVPERTPIVVPEEAPDAGSIGSVADRLDEVGVARFGDAYTNAREQARDDAREVFDEKDVPIAAREAIAQVENELGDELTAITDKATLLRVQIAEKGMRALEGTLYFVRKGVPELVMTGLELLDLHTKEKAYAALLEIIPTVSFWYAITGKRVKFAEGASTPTPEMEDIDKVDRLLYLAGSVFFLGHVYSGVRHALLKKGFFAIMKKKGFGAAAKAMLPALKQLVGPTVARAQRYGIRQLTKDRDPELTLRKPKSEEHLVKPEEDVKPE